MRVPFIAAWAKRNSGNAHQKRLVIPANQILPQVANVTDLFPTLLELAGVKPPKGHVVDGRSILLPLTGSRDHLGQQQFLMHYPHGPHRSNYFTVWRDGDWKVIYHNFPKDPPLGGKVQSGGERYELFNLVKDPFESTNVAKGNPVILKKMMQGLAAQLEHHDAVYPQDQAGKAMKPILP